MNISDNINGVIALMLGIVMTAMVLPIARDPLVDVVTSPKTQVASVTSDGSGIGTMTLDTAHFFSDAEDLTATGGTDGVIAASDISLNSARTGLTLTNLTTSATQSVTVTYRGDNGGNFNDLWETLPFFTLMAAVILILGGGFMVGEKGGSASVGAKVLATVITVMVGAIVAGVYTGFLTTLNTAFSNTPEFTGVTLVSPLLDLGYILAILGVVLGMFGSGAIRQGIGSARAQFGF